MTASGGGGPPKIRLKLPSTPASSSSATGGAGANTSSSGILTSKPTHQPSTDVSTSLLGAAEAKKPSTARKIHTSDNGNGNGNSGTHADTQKKQQQQRLKIKAKIRLPGTPGPATANGPYDSDDDENAHPLEEHAILRLPRDDPVTDKFRQLVKARKELAEDTELVWRDARRGTFRFGGEVFLAELVDLPCIVESQKTLDHKHFIKVADISQMIRISRPPLPTDEAPDPIEHFFKQDVPPEYYIENSGVTPPLQHCRIRRFRKRVNKRTVESIEREVARLLREDARALKVESRQLDQTDLEAYFAKQDAQEAGEQGAAGDQLSIAGEGTEDTMSGILTEDLVDEDQRMQLDASGEEFGAEPADEEDDDVDLEQELSKALADLSSDEEEEEEEEEDDVNQEDDNEADEYEDEFGEDDDDVRPYLEQLKLIREELKDFEEKIAEKMDQRDKSMNILMKKRFEDIIQTLSNEMELKKSQLQDVESKIEQARELHRRAMDGESGVAPGEGEDDLELDYEDEEEEGEGDGGQDEEVELDYGDDEYDLTGS